MCLVCGKPGQRLHWDSYGAALDDQGQFCSFECRAKWERGEYVHPKFCQCVTCIRKIDEAKAKKDAQALRKGAA